MAKKLVKIFVILSGLQLLLVIFVFFFAKTPPFTHAIFGMELGVYLFWIVISGLLMKRFRESVKNFVQKIVLDWRIKFIIFATLLALLEELITTAMTNTAPFYGLSMAVAHITVSANYWDVVLTNSVVLFFPMFCLWAWVLYNYDFSPNQVFLMWGISGCFMEMVYGGAKHILEIGFWVLVYGLMLYLPAYCIPEGRPVKKPQWWLYPFVMLGIIVLGVFVGGVIATVIKHIRPPHYFPGLGL